MVKAKKDLAADDNFPHLATTKAGVAHIEDRPPLIYHFDTQATKGYEIHAHSAFANYQRSLLPEQRALAHFPVRFGCSRHDGGSWRILAV